MHISTDNILILVFGICAVIGTIVAGWQGQKALRRPGPRAATDDIELQAHNELGPQVSHPMVSPPSPEVSRIEPDLAIDPIPLQKLSEAQEPHPAHIPVPPGIKANDLPLPESLPATLPVPQGVRANAYPPLPPGVE